MAILRASEVREKDDAEMESHLDELKKKLMKIRGVLASGGIPEDVGKTREIKKTIARIMTIQGEKKLGLKREIKKVLPQPKEKEEKSVVEEKSKPETPGKQENRGNLGKPRKLKTKKEEVEKKK
ncbi:MAG: 50S ribosomal protein L29 [Candidatus Altiarchaeales archaeon]|nr:50S ribosomal protein L29 [Candidatus Altiarchaeales archaeon]